MAKRKRIYGEYEGETGRKSRMVTVKGHAFRRLYVGKGERRVELHRSALGSTGVFSEDFMRKFT